MMRKITWGIVLASLGVILWVRSLSDTPQRVVIRRGASVHEIASALYQQHLIIHPLAFWIWAKFYGSKVVLRPGIYLLRPRGTGFLYFRMLRQGPPSAHVTFPEGWTSTQMAALLEQHGITPAGDFEKIVQAKHLEGFLFPDTYYLEQGLMPEQVIDIMVHRFHEKEPRDMVAQAKKLHISYKQLVIMASLVEREAEVAEERPIIAGVFYNRLRKRWRLESCATVQYALGWKPHLTYKDLEVNSPFNTYRHFGLPPEAICNPGAASLDAVAHPAQTDMMFFVANGQGRHRFSKDYEEHLEVQKGKSVK